MSTERRTALDWADQLETQRRATAWPVVSSTARRHPRTLAEAWPQHYAWRGVLTRYRRPLAERVAHWITAGALLAAFAGLGVLLAWRG
jgi:hypothetical protein